MFAVYRDRNFSTMGRFVLESFCALAVVGKLLLKSNCVTLRPLLLKETSNF